MKITPHIQQMWPVWSVHVHQEPIGLVRDIHTHVLATTGGAEDREE